MTFDHLAFQTSSRDDFRSSEGLRHLLVSLAEAGEDAWRSDPLAAALLRFAQEKYMPVAKAWHRDPADAAYEAFLAMRSRSTLAADDPWAVITRAVELGIAAEAHAERLLTSSDKARRPTMRPLFEPVRASDDEEFFFHVLAGADPATSGDGPPRTEHVVREATTFLIMTGWHHTTIGNATGYVCQRLTELSSTQSALDVLRKDAGARLRLGYTSITWSGLLRLLIGPRSKRPAAPGDDWARLGIFARVLLGDRTRDLLKDRRLVAASRAIIARSR